MVRFLVEIQVALCFVTIGATKVVRPALVKDYLALEKCELYQKTSGFVSSKRAIMPMHAKGWLGEGRPENTQDRPVFLKMIMQREEQNSKNWLLFYKRTTICNVRKITTTALKKQILMNTHSRKVKDCFQYRDGPIKCKFKQIFYFSYP